VAGSGAATSRPATSSGAVPSLVPGAPGRYRPIGDYAFLGDWVGAIVEGAIRSPQAAKDVVRAFADAGVTELVFDPTVASVDEVDRLADAVL